VVRIYKPEDGRPMWFIYINQKVEDGCGLYIIQKVETDVVRIYKPEGGRPMWFIYIIQKVEDRCGSYI